MFGISGWALLLGGIDSEIHNAKVRLKAPFRKFLYKRYTDKYNKIDLFESFVEEKNDISLWSKHYSNSYYGSGLFVFHLIDAYKKKGYEVKLISSGQKHHLAHYFETNFGFSSVKIDIDEEDKERLFDLFVKGDYDILSLDHTVYSSRNKLKRDDFLGDMFERLSKLPNSDNTIYLSTLLFVDEKEKNQIDRFISKEKFRIIHFKPDYSHWIEKMDNKELNILFPFAYSDTRNNHNNDFSVTKKVFADCPDWVIKSDHYFYNHFVYKTESNTGFYFMKNTENEKK